ncbi:MAG: BatD family protein [Candidatus Hydrogenedens sp.]
MKVEIGQNKQQKEMRIKINIVSLLLFVFFFYGGVIPLVYSQDLPIQVQVNPSEVGVGDSFDVIISIQGTNVGEPVISSEEGIKINPQSFYNGMSTQMQIGFGQSRIVTTKERHYRGYAQQEGEWKIFVRADVDGKQYVAPEVKIKVSKTASSPQTVPSIPSIPQRQPRTFQGRKRQSGNPGTQTEQTQFDQALIVESELSKRIVFQGEVLTVIFRAKILESPDISIQTTTGNLPDLPVLDDFYMGKVQQNTRKEDQSGKIYRVIELSVPVCPKSVGTLTVSPWEWNNCYIRYFNNWGWPEIYSINKSSEALNLEVRALPDAPNNYYGAVGKYTLTSNLSQTEVNVGTPIYLSMTIRGSGNPDFIRAPSKPILDWAYISDAEIISGNTDTWDNVEKTIRFSITPMKPGDYEIPVIEYNYFNPQIGQYTTLRTNSFKVKVNGEAKDVDSIITAGGTPRMETRSVDLSSSDLLPLITEGIQLKPRRYYYKGSAITIFILFPLISMISIGLGFRKEYLRKNPIYLRKISAYTNAIEKFNELKIETGIPNAVEQSLKQYIGDATGSLNTSGLTSDDIENIMRKQGIGNDFIYKTVKLLKTCERIRYSGSSVSVDESKGLEEGFNLLIEELKKTLR